MTDLRPENASLTPQPAAPVDASDPLASLHKMSTTAGLGTTDYVAVNGLAVTSVFVGIGSALSLLDNVLLVIPLVGIVMAVVALRQIAGSGGTQTGRGLAWLGILLALGFAGFVGGRKITEVKRAEEDRGELTRLIDKLGKSVASERYSDGYALFSSRFTRRVTPEDFAARWKAIAQGDSTVGKLLNMQSNGRMEFDVSVDTGLKEGAGMAIVKFERNDAQLRLQLLFLQSPDGAWQIEDVPELFRQNAGPGAPLVNDHPSAPFQATSLIRPITTELNCGAGKDLLTRASDHADTPDGDSPNPQRQGRI